MKPKDVRVLRVNCDHSEGGKWRVHLLEEEWKALSESHDRIFQDRYDLLTVHTKEGMLASEWLMRTATAERERDEARERCAVAEQRALDAECERDACRGMEQAAEMRAERLFRDRALVDERARKAAQLLIAEVGADRPMNVEEAAEAAVKEINRLKMRLEQLEWGNEMACENTPNPACECPGCETARERSTRGETGPRLERDEARAELAFIESEYAAANESDLTRDALCLQVASLRALIREAHRELSTIEAITVSPSDTDGLIQLCKRLADAGGRP
jgi:hypothetical protein